MKTLKKNIFRSVLFVCLGLTITTIVFASTRNYYTTPSRPGAPVFTDYSATGCALAWTEPDSDGGARITSYLIEVKHKYDWRWENKTIITEEPLLKCEINGMVEGTSAEFRVTACNKAGLGEPSDPSLQITFKPRK